jgi:hypothetical protein
MTRVIPLGLVSHMAQEGGAFKVNYGARDVCLQLTLRDLFTRHLEVAPPEQWCRKFSQFLIFA